MASFIRGPLNFAELAAEDAYFGDTLAPIQKRISAIGHKVSNVFSTIGRKISSFARRTVNKIRYAISPRNSNARIRAEYNARMTNLEAEKTQAMEHDNSEWARFHRGFKAFEPGPEGGRVSKPGGVFVSTRPPNWVPSK